MFNGKLKAVTFSYDDGVTQDKRLIDIFNKYDLKATFNINSELLGNENDINVNGRTVSHTKNKANDVKQIYLGHEVAVHTLTHPLLTELEKNEIIRQVEQDRINLSNLVEYEVVGMAYPCGGINNNEYVADVIKQNTSVKYVRTISSAYSFDKQTNLFRFNPTVSHLEWDKMFELADRFINMNTDIHQVFYIWGHSYELDAYEAWDRLEEFCRLISGRNDIHYGTNRDILLE